VAVERYANGVVSVGNESNHPCESVVGVVDVIALDSSVKSDKGAGNFCGRLKLASDGTVFLCLRIVRDALGYVAGENDVCTSGGDEGARAVRASLWAWVELN
jgi:hypothetical protein